MIDSLVFNGINSLDFQDVRVNVIRIPEVSRRIQETQEIWDRTENGKFDFYNFIASEDRVFLGNIKLKSLAAAVVQMGLFDRYLKQFQKPKYFIGNFNGDSALKVATGQMTFEEMIISSQAIKMTRPNSPVQIAEEPLLSGISLTEYAVFENEDGKFKPLDVENQKMDVNKIIRRLIDDLNVKKFVNIGPGNILINRNQEDLALADIQILESIDLDPMLSWFWMGMQQQEYSVAQ